MFKIIIDGKIQPKERPRFGKGKVWTAKKTAKSEQKIAAAFKKKYPNSKPIKEACKMEILVCRKIPTNFSKKNKMLALCGEIKPVTRPDIDNQLKTIMDSLNGLAYIDDSQVCEVVIKKQYWNKEMTKIKISACQIYFIGI